MPQPEPFSPTKLYYTRPDNQPPKKLTANTPAELEGLLRMGWKREQ